MNMGMGYFKTEHGHTHLFAGNCLSNSPGYLFGKNHHAGQQVILDIKEVIRFLFGNNKHMSFCQGTDIEKSKVVAILSDPVTRYFAAYNA
jgi:hypothetical protein